MPQARSRRVLALGLSLVLSAGTLLGVSSTATAEPAADPAGQAPTAMAPGWSTANAPTRAESDAALRADPSADAGGRIVNGVASPAYPWMVELILSETSGGEGLCGGFLVTPVLVLTAGHCIDGAKGATAFLGRTSSNSGGTQIVTTAGYRDPAYNATTIEPDWGFVVLQRPATGFTPLKLAGPSEGALWRAGRNALFSGFGNTTEGGSPSPVLLQATLPVQPDGVCAAPNLYGSFFHSATMLCVGYAQGANSGTCQGDSGSALVVPGDNGVLRAVGVSSNSIGCARPGIPAVFSRMADPAFGARIQSLVSSFAATYPALFAASPDVTVLGSGAVPVGCTAAQAAYAPVAGVYLKYAKILKKSDRVKKALKKAKKKHAKRSKVAKLKKKAHKAKKKAKKFKKKKGGGVAAAVAANAIATCT